MAITIEINTEDIAAGLGISADELRRRMSAAMSESDTPTPPAQPEPMPAVNPPGTDAPATPAPAAQPIQPIQPIQPTPAPTPLRYRYTAGNSLSGVCAQCAQYVGMFTNGHGQDGVPVPPLHINCVCFLTPVVTDIFQGGSALGRDRFAWLESLSIRDLRQIVGKERTDLIIKGKVAIEDLYKDGELIPLHLLPVNTM